MTFKVEMGAFGFKQDTAMKAAAIDELEFVPWKGKVNLEARRMHCYTPTHVQQRCVL